MLQLTIEAGGFRVYGNKVASLAIAKYEGASGIYLFLTQLLIILPLNTTKVQVFYGREVGRKVLMRVILKVLHLSLDLSKGLYIVIK
jgi:hypothetical protein